MLSSLRSLDERWISSALTSVIQMSAFFAHTENLFLAIISDEQPHVGELAWRSTKKARGE